MLKFDFQQFLDYNKKYRITMLFSVPAISLLIAKSPHVTDHSDALKLAQSGAAPLGLEIQKAASVKLVKGQTFISQTWGSARRRVVQALIYGAQRMRLEVWAYCFRT
jgi:4-coumarate--CoA ligase